MSVLAASQGLGLLASLTHLEINAHGSQTPHNQKECSLPYPYTSDIIRDGCRLHGQVAAFSLAVSQEVVNNLHDSRLCEGFIGIGGLHGPNCEPLLRESGASLIDSRNETSAVLLHFLVGALKDLTSCPKLEQANKKAQPRSTK